MILFYPFTSTKNAPKTTQIASFALSMLQSLINSNGHNMTCSFLHFDMTLLNLLIMKNFIQYYMNSGESKKYSDFELIIIFFMLKKDLDHLWACSMVPPSASGSASDFH